MPWGLMLKLVATVDEKAELGQVIPAAASTVAGANVTVVQIGTSEVAVPLAQYPKESEVAVPAGIYVNVPFALSVTVPLVGSVETATPKTLISLAITPLPGSDTAKVWPATKEL